MSELAAQPARETLGARIGRLAREKRWNQSELARRLGIDRSDVNRVVNDRRDVRVHEIPLFAAGLDMQVEELLDGVELPPGYRRQLEKAHDSVLKYLETKAELDETRKRLVGVHDAFQEAMAQWDADRQRWTTERRQLIDRHEEQRSVLEQQLAEARREVAALGQRLAKSEAAASGLREEAEALRGSLAGQKANTVMTGILSGLAGAALGALGSAAVMSPNVDDEDEDEE